MNDRIAFFFVIKWQSECDSYFYHGIQDYSAHQLPRQQGHQSEGTITRFLHKKWPHF